MGKQIFRTFHSALIDTFYVIILALEKEDDADPDMAEMIALEVEDLRKQLKGLEDKLKVLLMFE